MNIENKMNYYDPESTMNFDQEHTVLYTFQYESASAQLVTTMGGNVAGGSVMQTEFDTGMTVPVDHPLTKEHALFYDDEDGDMPYRELDGIMFRYPNGDGIEKDLDDCDNHLIGVQIIDYRP
jgi:hypothetical protein